MSIFIFLWVLFESEIFLRVSLNRSTKYALSQKPGFLIVLQLIHRQNRNNSANYSWGIHQQKFGTKLYMISWWILWVGEFRNFYDSDFVKNYCLNLIYFYKALSVKCSKNEGGNLHMKDTSHLKIAWHSKRQKKKIGKRVRKTKNENNSITSITIFLLLLFYRKKNCTT